VLNISADHLDRYANLNDYHRAKHVIFRQVRQVVANRDDPLTIPLVPDTVTIVWWRLGEPDLGEFGLRDVDGVTWICRGFTPLLSSDALQLSGRHNLGNVLAALALGSALGLPAEDLLEGARRYQGLPHRCQVVGRPGGVRFINDSKGTNIGATIAALEGFASEGAIWLILGGQGKGQDFSLLKDPVAKYCAGVILLGEAATEIAQHLGHVVATESVGTLEEAVSRAAAQARVGDTVLLSPACASLDMFSGFAERGQRFHDAVTRLEVAA
jgi:UDP-N-acetylmuramoylalanine--D-glutamate ligase